MRLWQNYLTNFRKKLASLASRATIGRIVQKLQLTRKKKSRHANEAVAVRVQKLRGEYATTIAEVKLTEARFQR